MREQANARDQFEALTSHLSDIFAIPIAILKIIYSILAFVLGILLIPPKIGIYIITNYPMLTVFFFVTSFIMLWMIRRLTQIDIVNYVLYTAIPYGLSILYTVLSMFFPQIHTFSTIGNALLHPISWLLGLVEKVDQRAAPIRRTVEAMVDARDEHRNGPRSSNSPMATRRSRRLSERIDTEARRNDERVQCCVCLSREKSILLQPCHHLCLCETCVKDVKKTNLCPICRTPIEKYLNVFI